MFNMWFKNNKREEIDSQWIVYVMIIVFLFKMIELLIQSWEWVKFVIFLVIGIVAYFSIKYIKNARKENPVSLPKEFRDRYPIIPQYLPPKGLNSAEAWLLYNCKVDVSDLTSLVYQWAFEWLISIKNVKLEENWETFSQIELTKLKNIWESCPFFEREIFNSIFSAHDKKVVTNSFELRYALLLEDLEYHWLKKWWISKSTGWNFLQLMYRLLIILVFVLWYIYITWWIVRHPAMWILILVLLFACVLLGWYIGGGRMRLTDKWAKLAAYIIGYRNFIKSCDENMIKLYLKEDPLFIDKTLPYATAFGLETEFLNKITPLAEDWKAQYVNWKKVTTGMKIIAALLKSSNNRNKFSAFYHW